MERIASEYFSNVGELESLVPASSQVWLPLYSIESFLSRFERDRDGNVILSDKVNKTAIITNSYIGKDVEVWEYVRIRDSIIASHSVVGHCSEVARSIVMSKCSIPRFNYVGSSVLGYNVELGASCALATERIDGGRIFPNACDDSIIGKSRKLGCVIGDRTILGFGVHVNPGVCIGSKCVVMPYVDVRDDIPRQSVVSVPSSVCISPQRDLSDLGLRSPKRPGDK